MADLGYTTIGATTRGWTNSAGQIPLPMCKFTATQYGIASSITFRIRSQGGGTINCNGAVFSYGVSGGNPAQYFMVSGTQSTANGTFAWVTCPISLVISPGSTYWLACWGDDSFDTQGDTGGVSQQYYFGYVNTYGTYIDDAGGAADDTRASIYLTYTPRAADNSVYKTITGFNSATGLRSITGFASLEECEKYLFQQNLNKNKQHEKFNSTDDYRRHDNGLWLPQQKQIYTA